MSVIVTLSGTYAYANLKLAVNDWLARSDFSEEAVDTFIDLAEAKLNRLLRVRAMETVYFRPLAADGSSDVPQGYLEWKHLFLYTGGGAVDTMPTLANEILMPLLSVTSDELMTSRSLSTSAAGAVARVGPKFYSAGIPQGTYTLGGIYYKRFSALNDNNQTNWLTDYAPDLLLAVTLEQACLYIKAFDQAQEWAGRAVAMIEQVQKEDRAERMSGGRLITRHGVRGA